MGTRVTKLRTLVPQTSGRCFIYLLFFLFSSFLKNNSTFRKSRTTIEGLCLLSFCSHCPALGTGALHPGWVPPLEKVLSGSRSWAGHCSPRSQQMAAPCAVLGYCSPGSLTTLCALSKAEPEAGDIGELILVPTGDSSRDRALPRPAGDDTPLNG